MSSGLTRRRGGGGNGSAGGENDYGIDHNGPTDGRSLGEIGGSNGSLGSDKNNVSRSGSKESVGDDSRDGDRDGDDKDGKNNLTLMEEVLLLGLKDAQV